MKSKKEELKKEGGITLIALIITIIILVILAAVSINAAFNSGIINYAVNGTENYIREAEKEKGAIQNAQTVLENAILNVSPFVESKGVNTPKITDGMIPIRWDEVKGKWVVCARDDERWYDYASAGDIATNPTRQMAWANMMLSDGKYKAGTVEIETVVEDSELGSMFVWIPRYAYSMTHYKSSFEGTADENNGTTQNITNVVFLKGTTNEGTDGNRYARDYNAAEIEAAVKAEAVRAAAASENPTPISTPMIVHPAFTFGGKELTGIWVAKFEASMEGNNANTTAENNINALSKTLKILPNKESWRNINVGNAFKVCLNMKNENNIYGITTNTNTHLMKNSEWGAVAYLAASQYGTIPTFSNGEHTVSESIHNAYTAGSSTSGDYVTYKSQSTTGTEYGVYDMNGGAWEYVAAYWDNQNNNLAQGNFTNATNAEKSFVQNATKNKYEINSTYAAYWDKYEVDGDDGLAGYNDKSEAGNKLVATAAYMRVQLMKSKKGDAMYEVINTFSYYGWNTNNAYGWLRADYGYDENEELVVTATNDDKTAAADISGLSYYGGDDALIGTSLRPFAGRGGYWENDSYAGVFYNHGGNGYASAYGGFRPAITQ